MKGYYERTKKKKPVDRGGRSHIWPVLLAGAVPNREVADK